MKGPRKFLRSSFETMSKENPEKSVFEDEIFHVISDTGNLEGSMIALIKELGAIEEKASGKTNASVLEWITQ